MIRTLLSVCACVALLSGCAKIPPDPNLPKGWVALPDPGTWCLRLRSGDLQPGFTIDTGSSGRDFFARRGQRQIDITDPAPETKTPPREFLDWLVQTYGREHGLNPSDVRLYVSHEKPRERPGHMGRVAGEIVCHPEDDWRLHGRFQITLYREVLIGETVSCLYSTIAHEFRHILQEIATDGATNCGHLADPVLQRFEQDAVTWASQVAPDCDCAGDR